MDDEVGSYTKAGKQASVIMETCFQEVRDSNIGCISGYHDK
jgi:hypothetical protein